MKIKQNPPTELLRELFICDFDRGFLFWRKSKKGLRAGALAGSANHEGYFRVQIRDDRYFLHRLIFAIFYGRNPIGELDHIDGNPRNNSISNLREATRTQNCHNKRGFGQVAKGVYTTKSNINPFCASIFVGGKPLRLGNFNNVDDAQAAYMQAALNHFGEFATIRDKSK